MNIFAKICLEILSIFLFSFAIPNEFLTFGSPLFAFLSLSIYFLILQNVKSFKENILISFCWAFFTHIFSSFWLANFKDFAIFTLGASAFGTGAIHAFFGIFFYLPRFAKKKIEKFQLINSQIESSEKNKNFSKNDFFNKFIFSNEFSILWFSVVFTVWEFVKCTGFLAYPWGTVSMTAYKLKYFVQIVDIGGVKLITFLFCFFSATFSNLIFDFINQKNHSIKKSLYKNKTFLILSAILFCLIEFYGIYQFNKPRKITKNVNTIFIQQNYDPWKTTNDSFSILESQKLTKNGIEDFAAQGKTPDLCVWSEAVLRYPFPEGLTHYKFVPESYPLLQFLKEIKVPTIIGAPWSVNVFEKKFSNAAILFDKDATIIGNHSKIHLVPFAELVPFTQYKIVRTILQKLVGFSNGWVPGTSYNVFEVPLSSAKNESVKLSIPICFEDAFSNIFARLKKNGTELFVNITDDSWSLTKSAEYQHFVIAYFRAIEFRTTLIRSTNSGYTVAVAPSGKIVADLPLFTKTHLSFSVPIFENVKTFYLIFGEWLSYLCIIFMIFVLAKVIFIKK